MKRRKGWGWSEHAPHFSDQNIPPPDARTAHLKGRQMDRLGSLVAPQFPSGGRVSLGTFLGESPCPSSMKMTELSRPELLGEWEF